MRYLMKIEMPAPDDSPEVADPSFNEKMRALLLKIGARSASFGVTDGRRTDHIIVDVKDEAELAALAEPFVLWLRVKPEFLPELSVDQARPFRATVEKLVREHEEKRMPGPADLPSFLAGKVHGADFHHLHHVRAAFELLKKHDFLTAAKLFSDGIKMMNEKTGHPDNFHLTLTMSFLSAIAERAEGFEDCERFIAAFPELLDKKLVQRWYSSERLWSAFARRTFLLPDKS